ncbi:MAG: hypothetical protein HC788_05265 [Sphingopyxis sp.]|nr:hypothetical protein [Sphingopyxis sp.]
MSVDTIISELSSLDEEQALRVTRAVLTPETALGRAMSANAKAMVAHYMIECTAENSKESELFKKLYGNFIKAVIREAFIQAQEMCFLPFKYFYSEAEVNKLLGKGPQYLKTRRASGKSTPKPCQTDGANLYSVIDIMDFAEENQENANKKFSSERGIILIADALQEMTLKVNKIIKKCSQK